MSSFREITPQWLAPDPGSRMAVRKNSSVLNVNIFYIALKHVIKYK